VIFVAVDPKCLILRQRINQKTTKNMSQNNTLHFSPKIPQSPPAPAQHCSRRIHFPSISGGNLKKLIPPAIPPLRSLQLPSLRVPCGALLPAAPLGVPNAVAFAPLGYAVRSCPSFFAVANRLVQKLTTHSATFSNIKTIRRTLLCFKISTTEINKNILEYLIYDY